MSKVMMVLIVLKRSGLTVTWRPLWEPTCALFVAPVGKLAAYDTDGDGDFDVEDAKVLLGKWISPISYLHYIHLSC